MASSPRVARKRRGVLALAVRARAFARGGGRAPGDLSAWLPWSMSAERRRALTAPG